MSVIVPPIKSQGIKTKLFPWTNNMKKIALFILLLALSAPAFAKEKHDARYLKVSRSYSLNEDGSLDFRFRKELQLFTTASFDTYGETFILYNPEFETLTVNESYTRLPDGRTVTTPANALNAVLPSSCADCARFNAVREMVVTHTALETGAVIVLDYTIHTPHPYFQELAQRVPICEEVPVDTLLLAVTLPDNRTLHYDLHSSRLPATPAESAGNGTRTLTWTFTNTAAASHNRYLPDNYNPYVLLSTFDRPGDFLTRLSLQQAFMPPVQKLLPQLPDETLRNATDPLDTITALHHFVYRYIRTNHVPMHCMNFIIASPATVLNTGCATPFEKNLLLHTLLKEAGYASEIGILAQTLTGEPEGLLQVNAGGAARYLSANEPFECAAAQGQCEGRFITLSGREEEMTRKPHRLELLADLHIAAEKGHYKVGGDLRKSESAGIPAATVAAVPNGNCAAVSHLSGNYYALTLTHPDGSNDMQAALLPLKGETPVQVNQTDECCTYTVALPAGAQWVSPPFLYEKSCDFGATRIKTSTDNGKLTITRQLTLQATVLESKKELRQLREMMGEWNAKREYIFKQQ